MRVVYSCDDAARLIRPGEPLAVTIGNFDGVHVGHRELIRITREKAAARGTASVLVTFDPHPAHVVRGIPGPGILTPLPRKLELLKETGLDAVLVYPFTGETAAMSAGEFVRTVLAASLRTADLVMGYNFALGRDRSGDYGTLRELGLRYGFSVTQVPPVVVDTETASSTLVRERVRSGDMEKAARLLGRAHSADGTVVRGRARGSGLGFPTANIDYGSVLLPPFGAYATWVQVLSDGPGAPPRMGMTSVGTNPTFGGGAVTLETHVLDFSGDLYGKTLRVHFIHRLRGEIHFRSVADLVARLERDAISAREALKRDGAAHLAL